MTSIAALLKEHRSRHPDEPLPLRVPCDGHQVMAADVVDVPRAGRLRLTCLTVGSEVSMGVDLGLNGEFINDRGRDFRGTLRTWWEPDLEDVVEYAYESADGKLRVTTVQRFPREGDWFVDQWTGESGMWVEVGPRDGVDLRYHCNHRDTSPRTFEDMIFDLEVF